MIYFDSLSIKVYKQININSFSNIFYYKEKLATVDK